MTCAAYEQAGTFTSEHLQDWTWVSPKQFAKVHLSRYMSVFQPLEGLDFDHAAAQPATERKPILLPAAAPKQIEANYYLVKEGDTVWSIAREIVEAQSDCLFDAEVRRQDTRRVALAIAQAYGAFHPDSVELVPGSRIHVALQQQGVSARLAS